MKKFKKIYVEITNICNLSCSFCLNNKREKKFMNVSDFSHIIDEIKPYTDYIYLHVKGEPLLNPNLNVFLDICDNSNIAVNITTNGTLLNKNKDVLKRHKCVRQINVSLHSENDEEDYFEMVFSACDYLKDNIYICYRLWTLHDNVLDSKAEKIVAKIIKHYNLEEDVIKKILFEDNVKITNNIFINKANMFEWPNMKSRHATDGYCHGTIDHVGILVDGTVVPCCLDGEGVINLGNVLSTSFVDIINSERFLNMKNNFENNICVEKLCKKCTFKDRFE